MEVTIKERVDNILKDLDYKPPEQWRERIEQLLTEEFSGDEINQNEVWVTRYHASTRDAASYIDIAAFEGTGIDFQMPYDMAQELFRLEMNPGETQKFMVKPFTPVEE